MPEFSCILAVSDAPHVIACLARRTLSWIDDGHYDISTIADLNPRRLLDLQSFPHGAYGYFEKDLSGVTMSKIKRKKPGRGYFYAINDLHEPEHLRLYIFLKRADHAGLFSISHHSKFLGSGEQATLPASTKLKSEYRTLKADVTRCATKVGAGNQQYFVLPGAAHELLSGSIATAYGEAFDREVAQKLAGRNSRGMRRKTGE